MKNASRTMKQVMALFLAVCLVFAPFGAIPAKAENNSVTITLNAGDNGKIYDGTNTVLGEDGTIYSENVLVDTMESFFLKITEEYSVTTTDPKHIAFAGWHLEGNCSDFG